MEKIDKKNTELISKIYTRLESRKINLRKILQIHMKFFCYSPLLQIEKEKLKELREEFESEDYPFLGSFLKNYFDLDHSDLYFPNINHEFHPELENYPNRCKVCTRQPDLENESQMDLVVLPCCLKKIHLNCGSMTFE
jgi:hypothetical protein